MSALQLAYGAGGRLASDPGHGAIANGGAVLAGPGMPYDETAADVDATVIDPAFCSQIKSNGHQCGARPVRDADVCVGHLRQLTKQG